MSINERFISGSLIRGSWVRTPAVAHKIKQKRIYKYVRKHSDNEIINAVNESFTYADVCRKLNMIPAGGSYNVVKRYIKELNLSIDHFTNRIISQIGEGI